VRCYGLSPRLCLLCRPRTRPLPLHFRRSHSARGTQSRVRARRMREYGRLCTGYIGDGLAQHITEPTSRSSASRWVSWNQGESEASKQTPLSMSFTGDPDSEDHTQQFVFLHKYTHTRTRTRTRARKQSAPSSPVKRRGHLRGQGE
jgi:hypothetical protein